MFVSNRTSLYADLHALAAHDTSSEEEVYELWQSDFVIGRYRIQKSGTYRIMEDITFDSNAGN